jgi:hypothetical protein
MTQTDFSQPLCLETLAYILLFITSGSHISSGISSYRDNTKMGSTQQENKFGAGNSTFLGSKQFFMVLMLKLWHSQAPLSLILLQTQNT